MVRIKEYITSNRWYAGFERKFEQPLTLNMLRAQSRLKNMRLLQRGNRLSIMPVTRGEWNHVLKLSEMT